MNTNDVARTAASQPSSGPDHSDSHRGLRRQQYHLPMSTRELLAAAQAYATAYLDDVAHRHVGGTVDRNSLIERLGGPLPEASSDPHLVNQEFAMPSAVTRR